MFLFSNNAKSSLAAPINTAATTLILSAGTGALFPNPGGGDLFALTLTDAATGQISEIMHCTARTGDTCTVVRAQEGTTALNWTTGDFANLVITAGTAAAFVQAGGSFGTMAEQNADDVDITGGSGDFTSLMVDSVAVATNPTTTKGDIIVNAGSGVLARLGAGSDGQVLVARAAATLGVDWEAASSGGTNLQWIVPTGFTDTEMAVAVAAINAATNGGVLYLPPGTYTLNNTYSFTKPVTMIGCGCADQLMINALTWIKSTQAAADLFDFTVDPFQVRDVHIQCTAGTTPTAGCGIHSTGHNGGHKLQNVTVQGFWNNIQIDNQGEWSWVSVTTYGWVNWGWYIRNVVSVDGGDQSMVNCIAIADNYASAAALRWESGGGLKIANLKINKRTGSGAAVGIDIAIAASAVTSDFSIVNSSIENVTAQPIKIRNSAGGTLQNINIHVVQFANYSSTLSPVDIAATSTGVFDRINLGGLIFAEGSSSVSAISITNVDNVGIDLCTEGGHTTLVTLSGVTNYRNANARLGTVQLASVSGAIPIDCTNAESFNITLSGNGTLGIPTNCASGLMGNLRIHGNGHSLTLASGWKCPGGVAPTLSASNFDVWSFQYDGFDNTFAVTAVQNFS